MKRSFRSVLLFTILSSILLTPMTTAAQKPGHVRHVVVFKYKKDATPDKIAQVTNAFRDLKAKIPGIVAFEDGVNNSPEGKNLGFTHVYQLTFDSVATGNAISLRSDVSLTEPPNARSASFVAIWPGVSPLMLASTATVSLLSG